MLTPELSDLISFNIEKEPQPVPQCEKYTWRSNSREDSRYDTIGYTSLYMLQYDNGVLDLLNDKIPGFIENEQQSFMDVRQLLQFQVMTRKRYPWNI